MSESECQRRLNLAEMLIARLDKQLTCAQGQQRSELVMLNVNEARRLVRNHHDGWLNAMQAEERRAESLMNEYRRRNRRLRLA